MIPSRITQFCQEHKGVIAIEMALIAPIFIGLVLATVDFGSVFYVHHRMNAIANDVSRDFALGHLTASEAKAEVEKVLPRWNSAVFTVTASNPIANDVQIEIRVPAEQAALVNFAPMRFVGDLVVQARKRKI